MGGALARLSPFVLSANGESMTPTKAELIAQCRAAQAAGADFPTLWNEVLRPHPLVIGPPVQTVRDGRIRREIRLITGTPIAFDSETDEILPE